MSVTVLGSGIVGLYTAYALINNANVPPSRICVMAKHMPGDQSIDYTSPWAGGNFSCISPNDRDTLAFDKYTYTHLAEIQRKLGGPICGLDMLPSTEYWDSYPGDEKIASLKSYLKDFRVVPASELPAGVAFGISFTTWNFNCPLFLSNFKIYLETLGVVFVRKELTHIVQAYLPNTKVVINCTGIGAAKLKGVADTNVYPTRGQVVVVKAPHIKANRMRWGDDYATYIIPRPNSKDQLVLGGFLQKDNWTADTFEEETIDIIERTTALFPEILDRPLEIIRVAAGLRPSRHGGVRIELETVENKLLVHNYGASGYGYQAGLGMAAKAVDLYKNAKGLSAKL